MIVDSASTTKFGKIKAWQILYYKEQVYLLYIWSSGLISSYRVSDAFTNSNIILEKSWKVRGVSTHLSSATKLIIFKDIFETMTPLGGTEELKGDFWFILADNVLYGFEVDENGESGTQPHNSV